MVDDKPQSLIKVENDHPADEHDIRENEDCASDDTDEINMEEVSSLKDTNHKKKAKKKWVLLGVIVIVIAGILIGCLRHLQTNGASAYVMPVSSISSNSYISGIVSRYSGVVEPQSTKDISFDSSKTLGELYVKEGDEVKSGDQLFSYSVSDMSLDLEQKKVDLEKILQQISDQQANIASLTSQKASAASDEQLELSIQIQQAETELKNLQYDQQSKQLEIDAKQREINNAIVTSPIDGTIQTINSLDDTSTNTGSAYITIVADGSFLIKGKVSELDVNMLSVDESMVIRSRVDETTTWKGKITSIDTSSTADSSINTENYSSSDSSNSASKYVFYVKPDSIDGMMVGQHVTLEEDLQDEDTSTYDGILLGSYYIVDIDSNPYVWKDENGKLKKQNITIGEYDDMTDEYEVLDGLSVSDSIAFPDDSLKEGMRTVSEYAEDSETDSLQERAG